MGWFPPRSGGRSGVDKQPERFNDGVHVGRRWDGKLEIAPDAGVAEAQRFGVEHDPGYLNRVERHDFAPAVRCVSKNRMAKRGEVDPNLMGPAGEGHEGDARGDLPESFTDPIARGRLLRTGASR